MYFEYALHNRALLSCILLKIGKATLDITFPIVEEGYIARVSALLKYPNSMEENLFPITIGYIFLYRRCINDAPNNLELYENN